MKNGASVAIGVAVWLFASLPVLAQEAKPPLVNSDVIMLMKAKMPESTIIITIQTRPSAFDTSPESLIALKKNGVTTSIIEAMLHASAKPAPTRIPTASAAQSAPSVPPATVPASGIASLWGSKQSRVEVDRVFLLEGDKRIEMKFTKPRTRTRWLFSLQQFAALGGLKARLRTKNPVPEFEMILPNNVEVSSVVALALLGERENGTREILIGGGFMSISQGLPKDRNIQIMFEKTADQSEAPEGYEIYRIKPNEPLKSGGEYAFMVSKPSGGAMGAFGGADFSYNFYELGID